MSARILLVEDNEQNRYLATFLLEQAGYTVVLATNGHMALQLASMQRPDLVLMDMQMPEMDGYEAAQRLHALPGLMNVPLVAVTAFAMESDRQRSREAGFAGHIEKPISTEHFVSQIRSFLPSQGPTP